MKNQRARSKDDGMRYVTWKIFRLFSFEYFARLCFDDALNAFQTYRRSISYICLDFSDSLGFFVLDTHRIDLLCGRRIDDVTSFQLFFILFWLFRRQCAPSIKLFPLSGRRFLVSLLTTFERLRSSSQHGTRSHRPEVTGMGVAAPNSMTNIRWLPCDYIFHIMLLFIPPLDKLSTCTEFSLNIVAFDVSQMFQLLHLVLRWRGFAWVMLTETTYSPSASGASPRFFGPFFSRPRWGSAPDPRKANVLAFGQRVKEASLCRSGAASLIHPDSTVTCE